MKHLTSIIALGLTITMLRADCPSPTWGYYWQPGSQVPYAFPPNNPPTCWAGQSIVGLGIDGDINGAFSQFNFADNLQNGSRTQFSQTVPYSQLFTVWAQTVVDYSNCGTSLAAHTVFGLIDGTNIIGQAETTFYLGSNSPAGYANYDPNASNYHAFIQKIMAHEIGHTMNLDEQPDHGGTCNGQVAGQSIMNSQCGTNDQFNNLPAPSVGLPDCDNMSIL